MIQHHAMHSHNRAPTLILAARVHPSPPESAPYLGNTLTSKAQPIFYQASIEKTQYHVLLKATLNTSTN